MSDEMRKLMEAVKHIDEFFHYPSNSDNPEPKPSSDFERLSFENHNGTSYVVYKINTPLGLDKFSHLHRFSLGQKMPKDRGPNVVDIRPGPAGPSEEELRLINAINDANDKNPEPNFNRVKQWAKNYLKDGPMYGITAKGKGKYMNSYPDFFCNTSGVGFDNKQ